MAKPKRMKTTKAAPAPLGKTASTTAVVEETEYTLADVVKRLGEATKEEARLEIEGLSDAELTTKGSRVATPRLAKELARNYGAFAAFLPRATKKQLDLLGFVSADWLRIAAWAAHQAELHHEALQRSARSGATDKLVRVTLAETLGAEAKHARGRPSRRAIAREPPTCSAQQVSGAPGRLQRDRPSEAARRWRAAGERALADSVAAG